MTNYTDSVNALIALLVQANYADTEYAKAWQLGSDSLQTSYFGELAKALVAIAGEDFYAHWVDTGEVDMSKASRNEVVTLTEEAYAALPTCTVAPIADTYSLGGLTYAVTLHGRRALRDATGFHPVNITVPVDRIDAIVAEVTRLATGSKVGCERAPAGWVITVDAGRYFVSYEDTINGDVNAVAAAIDDEVLNDL